jgi:hypothetical protein
VCSALFSVAQIDVKFIDHLSVNNLGKEHQAYLLTLSLSDSAYYYKARYSLKYQNDSALLSNFFNSKTLSEKDTLFLKETSVYFLSKNNSASHTWFTNSKSAAITHGPELAYKAGLNPNPYPTEIFPPELQKSFKLYRKAYRKSPLLASALSLLLPGSGKLYAGKTKTFLLTFMLNAAYALQTAESAQKLGLKNPFTIINAGAFAVFYLSNIYGGYKAVTDLRKERKKQFLTDAANFYN